MSYKFKKYNISPESENENDRDYDYGVDYYSLQDKEIALFQINSHEWTSDEVQNLIDEINALEDDGHIQYQVEGGHLGIIIDKKGAAFFDLMNREQETEDFEWPTEKFIKFLKEFKDFLIKNGR
ncbi:hypothetical protein HNP38_002023 [Chryseobacterium defluvii]|uniref:Uncharacterized protein n=1 Tax=Chryseobacterium defluvii TaxID=160396 RepID=A0A840KFH5_9FLAO|nr:hypothetical protein [Chryseobacterium defluvii]MBB4806727.1 hypothetical protein [Chryseobacterium defluvii]